MRASISTALLLLAACSAGAPDAGVVGCETNPKAEVYAAGMKQSGDGSKLSFVLVSSDPGPPLRGTNTWKVKVLDTAGQPVTGATLTVTPFMPEHGHGSQVVPTVTAEGDQYEITNLYLFMPGLWQITVKAVSGGTTDSAAFTFCVAG
jgi:hypothetical protein